MASVLFRMCLENLFAFVEKKSQSLIFQRFGEKVGFHSVKGFRWWFAFCGNEEASAITGADGIGGYNCSDGTTGKCNNTVEGGGGVDGGCTFDNCC